MVSAGLGQMVMDRKKKKENPTQILLRLRFKLQCFVVLCLFFSRLSNYCTHVISILVSLSTVAIEIEIALEGEG